MEKIEIALETCIDKRSFSGVSLTEEESAKVKMHNKTYEQKITGFHLDPNTMTYVAYYIKKVI